MAKVTIGDTEYTVPELNFIALERAWPYIEQSMITVDPMIGPSAAIRVIAAGLMEAPGFDVKNFGWTVPEPAQDADPLDVLATQLPPDDDQIFEIVTFFLKKQLKATQIIAVSEALDSITKEAGLVAAEGEAPQVETETASPGTVVDTSQS